VSKVCLIWQSGGLGDILFTLKIGTVFAQKDYRVIWPVAPVYKNLNDYIEVEGVEFFNIEENFPHKEHYGNFKSFKMTEIVETPDVVYVPLDQAFYSNAAKEIYKNQGHEASNMFGKYAMCNIESDTWASSFSLKRNKKKEQELFKLLGSPPDIHLINNIFGTPPRWNVSLNKQISTPANMTRIEMRQIDEFCIFDWCGIIERALKIDTVATATAFLFEKLTLSCVPTIHSRNKSTDSAQADFRLMQKLYSKIYEYEV